MPFGIIFGILTDVIPYAHIKADFKRWSPIEIDLIFRLFRYV